MSTIEDILDDVPEYVRITHASMDPAPDRDNPQPASSWIVISFGEPNFGFGEITIRTDKQGRTAIDTEYMGKNKVLHILAKLVNNAIDEREDDPDKHALYNEIRGRRCSSDCRVCYPEPTVQ